MRKRMLLALVLATAAVMPAAAQQRGGIPTETQSRMADQESGMNLLWNAIGLLGLLGLIGLRKEHADDSYHPAAFE